MNQGNQWYLNGLPIQGATESTYSPIITGYYSDIVTVNSCSSDTSDKIYFIYTEIKHSERVNIVISPNPVNTILKISNLNPNDQQVTIKLLTFEGKAVKEIAGFDTQNSNEIKFDIHDLLPGIYLLQLNAKNFREVKKLIIQ